MLADEDDESAESFVAPPLHEANRENSKDIVMIEVIFFILLPTFCLLWPHYIIIILLFTFLESADTVATVGQKEPWKSFPGS